MTKPVTVVIKRSDGREFYIDNETWLIPNDGLDGWANLTHSVTTEELAEYDGSVLLKKRIKEQTRSIECRLADTRLNESARKAAVSFFNPKYSFEVYLTYQGRTLWCEGEQSGFRCDTGNIYAPVEFTWSILCPMPYLLSTDNFGVDVAYLRGKFGFPYHSVIDTREVESVQVQYAQSKDEYTKPISWQANTSGFDGTKRLWARTVTTYQSGNVSVSGPVLLGKDGVGYKANFIVRSMQPKDDTGYGWVNNSLVSTIENIKIDGIDTLHFSQASNTTTSVPSIAQNKVVRLEWGKTYIYAAKLKFPKRWKANSSSPLHFWTGSDANDTDNTSPTFNNRSGVSITLMQPAVNTYTEANVWQQQVYKITMAAQAPDSDHLYPKLRPFVYGNVLDETGCTEGWVRDMLLMEGYTDTVPEWTLSAQELVGTGVSAITPQYYLSSSDTTQTGGSWVTTCPAWSTGKYIWTRNVVKDEKMQESATEPYIASSVGIVPLTGIYKRGFVMGVYDFSNTIEIANDGDVETYPIVHVTASDTVVNPEFLVDDAFVRVVTTLKRDDTLIIDFEQKPPAVQINGVNALNKVDRNSTFSDFVIRTGTNTFTYAADDGETNMSVSLYYWKRYLGI